VNTGTEILEIWRCNYTHPNRLFSGDHISAPKQCCVPKFLHALEKDYVLLAHSPPGTAIPLTIFFKGGSKIGSKFYIRACSFWGKGSTFMKLCHMTGYRVGMITNVHIFGGLHPRNLGGPKSRKFGLISDNFQI